MLSLRTYENTFLILSHLPSTMLLFTAPKIHSIIQCVTAGNLWEERVLKEETHTVGWHSPEYSS